MHNTMQMAAEKAEKTNNVSGLHRETEWIQENKMHKTKGKIQECKKAVKTLL